MPLMTGATILVRSGGIQTKTKGMMVVDFLVECFFVYVRGQGDKGIKFSVYVLSGPLAFNLISLINLSKEYFYPRHTFRGAPLYPLFVGVMIFGALYLVNHLLERYYLDQGRKEGLRFNLPLVLYYVFGVVYFFTSVILGFMTFKHF